MEIRQLRYFASVAEHLNFTEASRHLFVAQPAISKQIANLENEIGIKLFERDKHSVRLTPAGAVFYEEVKAILEKLDLALKKARDAREGKVGHLNVGFLRSPVRGFFPALIKDFRCQYPDVQIELFPYQTGEILNRLLTGELDIGFTISTGLKNLSDFEIHPLLSYPHCIIMNSDHRLSQKDCISVSELSNENFIMLERKEAPQTFDFIIEICTAHGFYPKIVKQTSRIETVLLLIDSGEGISILPKYLLAYATPSLLFKNIEGDYKVELVVIWKKNNPNPSIPLFIEVLGRHVSITK